MGRMGLVLLMREQIVKQKKSVAEDHFDQLELATQKVNHYMQKRKTQHQIVVFQVQAAIFEFSHSQRNAEQVSRERLQQQMAVPVEPFRLLHIDIGDANCIYGKEFFIDWQAGHPPFIGKQNRIILLPISNSCCTFNIAQ